MRGEGQLSTIYCVGGSVKAISSLKECSFLFIDVRHHHTNGTNICMNITAGTKNMWTNSVHTRMEAINLLAIDNRFECLGGAPRTPVPAR